VIAGVYEVVVGHTADVLAVHVPPARIFVCPAWKLDDVVMFIAVHEPLSVLLRTAVPYTVMWADVDMLRPVAPLTQVVPLPSRMTDCGLLGAVTTTPPPMSFRNVPVRLYTYELPLESVVSVTVTLIDVGVPLHCGVAVGRQVNVTLCTLDATTRSLTSTLFWHSRRISLFDAKM
jgi:hypothetical protein